MQTPQPQLSISAPATSRLGYRAAGRLMLVAAGTAGIVAGGLTGYMRLEAIAPGAQYLCTEGARLWPDPALACSEGSSFWQALVTAHGLMMLFLVAIPALIGGLGLLMLPALVGVRDLAFPKLGFAAAVLQTGATAVAITALFAPDARAFSGLALGLGIAALQMSGLAMLLVALNAVTTFLLADGRKLSQMPVLAWALLSANVMVLLSMPVLAAAITVLSRGGASVDLLWVFGHPAILMLVLPTLGLVAQGVEAQTGHPLVGRSTVIGAFLASVGIGFFVWADRLLDSGWQSGGVVGIALGALCIGGPVLVTFLAAIQTLRKSALTMTLPLLWTVGLLTLMVVGLTGAAIQAGLGHDTAGLLHQTIGLGAAFAVAAGLSMRLARLGAAGFIGSLQFVSMSLGAVLLIGAEFLQSPVTTTAGAMACLFGAVLFVPLGLRAARG